MSSHGKNTALRVLLDEAEMSNSGLANAVVASGAREGIHLGTGTTSVKRMLDGSQPRWPVPRLVAAVLSRRLRRQVSVTECGFADRTPAEQDPHDGLNSSGTLEGTVRTVVELSGQDMRRRKFLLGSVFSAAAFTEPALLALTVPPAEGTARAAGRRVGKALIRVESSMHEQPGLFDVPTPELAAPPRTGRGRARETYARIVVADVVVQDAAVLRAAALRALDGGIVVAERPGPPDDDLLDPRDEVATSSAAALEWCLEPTAGLWPLLDAGAVQVAAADLAVDEVAAARVRAHWTVTITIRDVRAVRELALAACPVTDMDARTEIERSFAAAWHRAADPYAPMSEIPGVVWTPVEVTIEQVLARSR